MLARVVVCYRDTIIDVAHLRTGQRFTIGDNPAASLIVSLPEPDMDVFEIVSMTNEGAVVTYPRCGSRSIVRTGELTKLELGDISLHVSLTPAESLQLGRRAVDWGLLASVMTACAFAAVFALLMRLTPELARLDSSPDEPAYARYFRPSLDALPEPSKPSPRRPPPPEIPECGDGEPGAGGSGRASRKPAGREGRAGQKVRRQRARSSTFDPEVNSVGILGLMQTRYSAYEGSFAFGADDDDEDVWGGLTGTTLLGEDYGVGGLGLVGTGRGGGGTGEGTIGLGNTGLIGKGGWGGVAAGCPVCRRVKPRIRVERTRVEGALDGSIVHRVTKAKVRQLQGCYDEALRRAPKLKGKLELQYVIDTDGTVSTVLVEQSPNPRLGECMATVLRRSRFPPDSSSPTIVCQPITLDPKS
jgi:hypothetical protein